MKQMRTGRVHLDAKSAAWICIEEAMTSQKLFDVIAFSATRI